jgi:Cof subfamily protein (haloacid dehalogenase superfamily)
MNQKMKIKLVALDIDGTLLNDDYECDRETRELLQHLESVGVKIMLCTGRPLEATKLIAAEIGAATHLITDNGAVIYDLVRQETLAVKAIPIECYEPIIDGMVQTGAHVDVTSLTRMYTVSHSAAIAEMYSKYKVQPRIVEKLTMVEDSILKATLFAKPAAIDAIMAFLPEKLAWYPVQCLRSGPTFIDVMPKDSSKGRSLSLVCEMLGIDRGSILAMGNYYNDLDMIEFAGIGVAMENAPEDVKSQADHVTASNNEQGVKKALEHFVL